MIPQVGSEVYIQSYKHNGMLHRTWCKGYVVEANEERFVVITNKTWVIESDGRKWMTREPAVCFFWTKKWFNVISMIRKNGIFYYCNLATPSIYDGEAIKNIDYDLDVKLYPDWSYQILDGNEYNMHASAMHYSEDLKDVIDDQLQKLLKLMEEEKDPFNQKCILQYYNQYLKMITE